MYKSLIGAAIFSAAFASAAPAAQPDDAWLAFVGCWRAEGDSSDRSLCVVPDGDGVRMVTIKAGSIESETRVVANGQPRAINQEGCSGTETARWSADRQRVFLQADLNCGNNVMRKVSGIFAVLNGSQWASVQSITTAGNTSMHKVRYVESTAEVPTEIANAFRNNGLARHTVRLAAASPLDLADVSDAVANADTSVVQGWLTTVNQEFDLDAVKLIALADAGVPPSVIDVMIAVSNPRFFAVREERADDRVVARGGRGRRPGSCYDYWYDPYQPFGYRGGYYDYCGGGRVGIYPGWGGYYGGGQVIVIDRPGPLRPRGKVTRDGYKAPRDTDTSIGSSTQTTKTPSTTSTGSSSGSSDDSSSSGGGRKAKPRDN